MLWPQFSPPQDVSPQTLHLYLPSDPHSCLFDLSFDPYPAPPPLTSHGCTSHTVGAGITTSPLPHRLPLDPNSPHVLKNITTNANSHLHKYERKKLGRANKTEPSTSIITHGDTLIGDLLHQNMLLIPFAKVSLGRFSPLLQIFSLVTTQHHNFDSHLPDQMPPKCTHNYCTIQVPKVFFSWRITIGLSILLHDISMDTPILHPLLPSPPYSLLEYPYLKHLPTTSDTPHENSLLHL